MVGGFDHREGGTVATNIGEGGFDHWQGEAVGLNTGEGWERGASILRKGISYKIPR